MKNKTLIKLIFAFTVISSVGSMHAQTKDSLSEEPFIDPKPFADNSHHWYDLFNKENMINPMQGKPQYKPTDIVNIGDNILLMQKNNGGWPKNYDVFAILTPAQKDSVLKTKNEENTTFDNNSTHTQIAALAVVYNATKQEKYKVGVLKGLDFILQSQYDNGGWPQYYPLQSNYSRCITYNDGVMVGIMKLLKNILDGKPEYTFVDENYRKKLQKAYDKGLDCIIKTQIREDGKLNAWCQQYNEVTMQPAWARKFEPPCISNGEGADLVAFLMTIKHPSKELIDCIQSAVRWFDESKILYTRVAKVTTEPYPTKYRVFTSDKVVVTDSAAKPIWTRYYELKTHRPMFCNRDSIVVYSLAEVERERRDGYGWYIYGPQKVLDKYPRWQKKWAPDVDVLNKN
jgi:PelA/Pel-15E family pectate lyase